MYARTTGWLWRFGGSQLIGVLHHHRFGSCEMSPQLLPSLSPALICTNMMMVLGLQMLSQCCPGRSCRGRIDTLQTLSPKVDLLTRSGFLASVMRLRVRNKDVMGHWSLYCERSGGTEGGTCELGRSLQLLLRYNPPIPNPLTIAMSNPQGNTPDSVFTPMPSPYMRSTPPKNSKRIPNFDQPAPVPWRHHPVEDNKILENTPFKLCLWLLDRRYTLYIN